MKTLLNNKYVVYGGLAVGGLLLLKLWNSGIKGTTHDIAAGVVGGVIDAGTGLISGAYEALPDPVKPSSSNNIINQGVEKIGAALTGDPNFTLGGWIYDKTH